MADFVTGDVSTGDVLRRQGHIPTCKEVTTNQEKDLDLGHVVAPIFVGV